MSKKILIIDIETTGFLKSGGKIVEIGVVELDLNTGEKCIIFDQVMHESGMELNKVQDSWIVNNSSMTVEEIRGSKHLDSYRSELQIMFNSYELGSTAYNNVFDFGFLVDSKTSFLPTTATLFSA